MFSLKFRLLLLNEKNNIPLNKKKIFHKRNRINELKSVLEKKSNQFFTLFFTFIKYFFMLEI